MANPFDLDLTRNLALDEIHERIRALGSKVDRHNEEADNARRVAAEADQRVAECMKMRAEYQAVVSAMTPNT